MTSAKAAPARATKSGKSKPEATSAKTGAKTVGKAGAKTVPARFKVGDRVRVKDLPNLFYTRTQMYIRGVEGTIAARTYEDLIPEDEAWNRDDAQPEQYYIVRFRQKDLWDGYPFANDTLQSELPDRWLEPVS